MHRCHGDCMALGAVEQSSGGDLRRALDRRSRDIVIVINKPYVFVVVTRAAAANTLVYIHSILVCEQTSEMDAATMFVLSRLYRVILPSNIKRSSHTTGYVRIFAVNSEIRAMIANILVFV